MRRRHRDLLFFIGSHPSRMCCRTRSRTNPSATSDAVFPNLPLAASPFRSRQISYVVEIFTVCVLTEFGVRGWVTT